MKYQTLFPHTFPFLVQTKYYITHFILTNTIDQFSFHHHCRQFIIIINILSTPSPFLKPKIMDSENCKSPSSTTSKRMTVTTSATTKVHVTALDGIVQVNSLFTVAVFVGLSFATPGQTSLMKRPSCNAGPDLAEKLMVFEVLAFSFFLFSSLIAQGLKLTINILNSKEADEAFHARVNTKVLRAGMLGSATCSVLGCLFLMLSMVAMIEIGLGLFSCGSQPSIIAVSSLVTLVSTAILVYISTAIYAFLH